MARGHGIGRPGGALEPPAAPVVSRMRHQAARCAYQPHRSCGLLGLPCRGEFGKGAAPATHTGPGVEPDRQRMGRCELTLQPGRAAQRRHQHQLQRQHPHRLTGTRRAAPCEPGRQRENHRQVYRSDPVDLGRTARGLQQTGRSHRQRGPEQQAGRCARQRGAGPLGVGAPAAADRPGEPRQQQRSQYQHLAQAEFGQAGQRDPGAPSVLLAQRDVGGMAQRRPARLRVPPQVGRPKQQRSSPAGQQPRHRPPVAAAPDEYRSTRQQCKHAVLVEQAHATRRCESNPGPVAPAHHRLPQSPQRARPAQQQQRVGRRYHAKQAGNGAGHEQRCRPPGGGLRMARTLVRPGLHRLVAGDDIARERRENHRRQRIAGHRQSAHADLGAAKHGVRRSDQHRDSRWLGVVAPLQRARPVPILRLIDMQRVRAGSNHQQAQREQRRQRDHPKPQAGAWALGRHGALACQASSASGSRVALRW